MLLLVILQCLNRTFYGIETSGKDGMQAVVDVLIVPFMELKLARAKQVTKTSNSLNRTFYGIETL